MSTWDAIVVGAGPAGLTAAETLYRAGVRVLVLDAGPRPAQDHPPSPPDDHVWGYESVPDAQWLRVRAVGGGSLVWGGWCNRFPEHVFVRGGWPIGIAELAPFYADVERRLCVRRQAVHPAWAEALRPMGCELQAMQIASANGRAWRATDDSTVARHVRPNTVALSIERATDRSGLAEGGVLIVAGPTGSREALAFRLLMIACSPVETARLLLSSALDVVPSPIGRNLCYHPIAGFALVEPPGRIGATGAALLTPRAADGTPEPFSLELTGSYALGDLNPELRQQLHSIDAPPDARVTFIHGFADLVPHAGRYVELCPEHLDALGRPVPMIHLELNATERVLMGVMRTRALEVAEALAHDGGELVEYLDPLSTPMLFHEAGTCAFGASPDAPCDPRGRLRGRTNVWIADAAVFPSAGDRHPTLTILAHATRAACAAAAALRP